MTVCHTLVIWAMLLAPTQQAVAVNAVRVYVDTDAAAVAAPAAIPANIQVPGISQRIIADMLRSSPTFRRQCSRIGNYPRLRVAVERSVRPAVRPDGAVTTVRRTPDGRIDALVELGVYAEAVELVAHEFEHILEQLDEVDLAAMAARTGTGVYSNPKHGRFETDRAIAAGRRVAAEVANGRR